MSQRFLEYWSRGLTGTPAEVRARTANRFERWRVTGIDETKSLKPEATPREGERTEIPFPGFRLP
jgi:hypothetical protein